MISKNFHELLKLLAFSFCVCEGFGVCCRGVLESRVKALATADRRCVVSLFGKARRVKQLAVPFRAITRHGLAVYR